jgi:hypothetical protein
MKDFRYTGVVSNPFYVHVPMNRFKEPLVRAHRLSPQYEVRSVHTGNEAHWMGRDWRMMNAAVKRMNTRHQVELSIAAGI